MKRILLIAIIMTTLQVFGIMGVKSVNDNNITTEITSIKPDFEVYPNPASGSEILVSLKNLEYNSSSEVKLTISNVIGQVLLTYYLTDGDIAKGSFKVNLTENDIRKGMYFVKLSSGEQTTLKKLIVK